MPEMARDAGLQQQLRRGVEHHTCENQRQIRAFHCLATAT